MLPNPGPIESRGLRSERRLRCVWIGFAVGLRGFAHGVNVAVLPSPGPIESRALRSEREREKREQGQGAERAAGPCTKNGLAFFRGA